MVASSIATTATAGCGSTAPDAKWAMGGIVDPAFEFHDRPQPRHGTYKHREEDDENPCTAKKTQIFPGDCQGYPVGCYG